MNTEGIRRRQSSCEAVPWRWRVRGITLSHGRIIRYGLWELAQLLEIKIKLKWLPKLQGKNVNGKVDSVNVDTRQ